MTPAGADGSDGVIDDIVRRLGLISVLREERRHGRLHRRNSYELVERTLSAARVAWAPAAPLEAGRRRRQLLLRCIPEGTRLGSCISCVIRVGRGLAVAWR